MHESYLETLSLKADTLGETERKRYLAIALAQSVKVGRLAQALFELARLEHGNVQPALEQFSLVDLVQDVFQKFELPAEARHIQLRAEIPPRLPAVSADLGMIERVLTNLLDNAIRQPTPADGEIDARSLRIRTARYRLRSATPVRAFQQSSAKACSNARSAQVAHIAAAGSDC